MLPTQQESTIKALFAESDINGSGGLDAAQMMGFMQSYVTTLPGYEAKHVSDAEVTCVAAPPSQRARRGC